MTTTTPTVSAELPEALRLANALEKPGYGWHSTPAQCAAELRRLHQSKREGWRYADELKQDLDRLRAQVEALSAAQAGAPSDAMVDAYLQAQRRAVEEADWFGRPNIGGLHTNTVREACRAGLKAALAAAPQPNQSPAPAQPGQEGEREAFEAVFPVPGGVRWDGAEYVVSDDYINSYRCDRFIGQWTAWQASATRAEPHPATADAVDTLQREDFSWLVVQEACETEPADEDDQECIRILRRDLKSAVLAALLRHDAALAAQREPKP